MSSDDRVPCEAALKHAAKIAVKEDKPIMLDYWPDSYGETNGYCNSRGIF